ncbi:hypothetical protein Tco_0749122 [Tanacetum coccineum]|uniref:Uncharacterized protein n=1 Tax=Tanacetum coccineum TaxID=301880 RepID=A0ABQ4YYJ4_9ASTR
MLVKERSSEMYKLSSYFMSGTIGDLPMEPVLPTLFCILNNKLQAIYTLSTGTTRFISEAAAPLGFDVKKNDYKCFGLYTLLLHQLADVGSIWEGQNTFATCAMIRSKISQLLMMLRYGKRNCVEQIRVGCQDGLMGQNPNELKRIRSS